VARGSAIFNVLGGLFVVGTVVYAVAAQMATPPLEPAHTFMRWQALWGHGTYGVKYTFLVTWASLLCVPLAPFAVVSSIFNALARKQDQPEMPAWPRVEWKRAPEPVRALLGAVLTAVALAFAGACLVDPYVFVPVGYLATIVLIGAPFALLAGPLVGLDAVMPARVVVGVVEAVDQEAGSTADQPARHVLRVGGQRFEVAEALWRELEPGDEIALRSSAVFRRVLELARRGTSIA
jgi:hypothetical protein